MKSRWRRWLEQSFAGLAIAYPILLAVAWLLLRFVGERHWMTNVALYLPPAAFALPLPIIVIAMVLAKRRRLLWLQLVSLFLVVFPLMGFCVGWGKSPVEGAPRLRILSFNSNSAYGGADPLVAEILEKSPDLVFLQELPNADAVKAGLAAKYPHIDAQGEFMVASKFPIVEAQVPPRLPFYGKLRSPRFMRVVIDTSLGRVTFFHVHTVSPRGGFYQLRGSGFRREISSGRLLSGEHAEGVQDLAGLRELQVATVARMAQRESGPVLILGDTNLPAMSVIRHTYLSQFRDGFAEAGIGFGYTYPSKLPWMRIDLMLSSSQLAFSSFGIGKTRVSDHRCIFAELVSDAR